jgi:hypothetical protein
MNIDLDEVKQTIRHTPWRDRKVGTYAIYIPISDTVGVKLYQWENERDHTYKLQNIAAAGGYAPKVGEKFKIVDQNIHGQQTQMFGYVTEAITQTFREKLIDRFDWPKKLNYKQFIKAQKILDHFRPAIVLKHGLKQLRFTLNDFDTYNVGWLPDGRFVLIDFSDERIA